MNTTIRRTLIACVLAAAFAAAGCTNPGGSGAGKREGGKGTFDAGKTVPSDAHRVAQSSHTKLIHRAQRPENVWVEDGTTKTVIYSGPVRADSNVVVDPEANVVAVNDITVRHAGKLNPDHTYRLYFKGR
jgi:predicted small secreted protein